MMQDDRPAALKRSPFRAVAVLLSATCLVVLSAVTGCSKEPPVTRTETIRLAVEGMHCTGCARAIEATVARVSGVQSCSVSFEQCAATVIVADGTDADSLILAVEALDSNYHLRLAAGASAD